MSPIAAIICGNTGSTMTYAPARPGGNQIAGSRSGRSSTTGPTGAIDTVNADRVSGSSTVESPDTMAAGAQTMAYGLSDASASMLGDVIRPTLAYLDVAVAGAEQVLLAVVTLNERFPPSGEGLGPFGITPAQHRRVWDDYLAFNPDLASTVRGLASQRCFLQYPDRELVTNLAYACAITWILIATSGYDLPSADDNAAQVALWQRLFGGMASRDAAAGRANA